VNHHIGDLKLAQIQQPAEHVAVVLFDTAFVMNQVHGPAQPLGRRQQRLILTDLDAKHLISSRTIASTTVSSGPSRYSITFIGARPRAPPGPAR
jgi:hypothetical protein